MTKRSSLTETGRLRALEDTGLLDALPAASLDRFTRIAAQALGAPVAVVSLVDDHRQFFSSQYGLAEPESKSRETPLSHSFCKHVVETGEGLIVHDANHDPRVAGNGAIADLGVVAYAGLPIRTYDGFVLGSFCIIDGKPREWTERELTVLTDLRDAVVAEIDLRRGVRSYARSEQTLAGNNLAMHGALDASTLANQRAAHDIRSPLGVITMGVKLLQRHQAARSYPELAQMLERILRNAQHVGALLTELTNEGLVQGPVMSADVVAVGRQVASDRAKAGLRIECEASGAPAMVPLGDTALRRCIENVFGNALRFARERVRLSVGRNGEAVVVAVEDDGPGLPSATHYASAWEQGVRHHPEQGSGTGLGLAIVKELVEDVGGYVEAGPSPLGGARFALVLPLVRATPPAKP